jgi:hypothetical protein
MTEILQGMIETKERFEADLLKRPGVVALAVGFAVVDGQVTDMLAIKIYVKPSHPVSGELPESLEGYPVNVVEHRFVEEGETVVALPPPGAGADIGAAWGTLEGGMTVSACRLGNFKYGTVGAIVIDKKSGWPMLLSAYHVIADAPDWPGTIVTCPQILWTPCKEPGGAAVGRVERAVVTDKVEAAVARLDVGLLARGRGWGWNISEIGPMNGTVAAWPPPYTGAPRMKVRKHGTKSGLTFGEVERIDGWSTVELGGKKVEFFNQIVIVRDPDHPECPVFAVQGDSGSLVVDVSGRVLGMVSGIDEKTGTAFANPIKEVTEALGIVIPGDPETVSIKNKATLDESTSAAPVLATDTHRPLVLTWPGTSDSLINIATLDQAAWNKTKFKQAGWKKATLNQKAYNKPAIVLAPAGSGRRDYIAWTGTNSTPTPGHALNVAALGENWSIKDEDHTILWYEHSYAHPALAVTADGTLVLAWTGTDSQINIATSTDGGKTFDVDKKLVKYAASADTSGPWLANIDKTLYLLWPGPRAGQEHPCIAKVILDPVTHAPLDLMLQAELSDVDKCGGHPSMEAFGQLVLAWRGQPWNSIVSRVSRIGQVDFEHQLWLDEQTQAAPSLCRWDPDPSHLGPFGEMLCIAWTGTDGSINVAELRVAFPCWAKMRYDPEKRHKSGSYVPIDLQLLNWGGENVSGAGLPLTAAGLFPSPTPGKPPSGTFTFETLDTADGKEPGYRLIVGTTGYPAGPYNLSVTAGSDPHTITGPWFFID